MVRRRSTVRFRKGAPFHGAFSKLEPIAVLAPGGLWGTTSPVSAPGEGLHWLLAPECAAGEPGLRADSWPKALSSGTAVTDVMITKVRAACRVTGCRRSRWPDRTERATELIFGSPGSHFGWLRSAPDPVQADLSARRERRAPGDRAYARGQPGLAGGGGCGEFLRCRATCRGAGPASDVGGAAAGCQEGPSGGVAG